MVEVGHGVIFVFACKTPPLSLVPRPLPPQWPGPRDESSVYVYVDEKKVWLEIFPLPVLANQLVACLHDGRLVVAGKPHRYSAHEGPFVYELDLPSGAWTSKCVLDRQWPEVGHLSALVSFPRPIDGLVSHDVLVETFEETQVDASLRPNYSSNRFVLNGACQVGPIKRHHVFVSSFVVVLSPQAH